MSGNRSLLALCAGMLVAATGASVAEESPLPNADYGVSAIWPLGGPGGWDYLALEPSGARLFVSRGDHVDVIETASGRRTGIVANTAGVHGIAFAPELKRGYTSNGHANTVTAFELDTLQLIQESPVAGKKPDAILYEPRMQHVFTANGDSHDIDVLDPMTLQVIGSIALPGPPEFMATDAAGTVFVNIETDPGKLVAIDARTLKIKATWPLPGCANPTGLAIDPAGHRLFSVCEDQVMTVTDSTSGWAIPVMIVRPGRVRRSISGFDGARGSPPGSWGSEPPWVSKITGSGRRLPSFPPPLEPSGPVCSVPVGPSRTARRPSTMRP